MLFHVVIATIAGVASGIVTGLTPGIHINLVAVFLLSISPWLLQHTSPIVLAVFILAMSITHTFLDALPSIYLGAPDASNVLAVLPGHKLLLKGKAFEAVKLTVIGSLICLLGGIILVPALIYLFPLLYQVTRAWVGWILVGVILFLLFRESTWRNRLWSTAIFLLSGVLGILVLGLPQLSQPLFPLLSGLFGVSTLITAVSEKVSLPKQTFSETINVPWRTSLKAIVGGTLSGSLISVLPGMGPSQAAVLVGVFLKNLGDYGYLILVGGINTVNFLLSLVTVYTLSKARNGSIIVLQQVMGSLTLSQLVLLLAVGALAGCIAAFLTLKLSRCFSWLIQKVNYGKLCIGIIALITVLVILFSGPLGLFVLVVSTAVGLVPALLGIGRSHAMGCLLLPVILFFLL